MNLDVLDIKGKKSSQIAVDEKVYGKVNENLFYEVVKMQLANRRSGTASTKTRSEVSGGGAKPWKQKGSGRARAGTNRSPIWRHGGTCFGPKPRDYSYSVPKKVMTAALRNAVALKIRDKKIRVFDKFEIAEPKTKLLATLLKGQNIESALIVVDADDKILKRAAQNLKGFKYILGAGVNVYDILNHDELIITKEAFDRIGERVS
ncbi:MAG: 50S ribosomal protein L4 [Proteobacteria bacterium]|nr:50S ribosomal protein L4 [Pseudomonadota bacterium]